MHVIKYVAASKRLSRMLMKSSFVAKGLNTEAKPLKRSSYVARCKLPSINFMKKNLQHIICSLKMPKHPSGVTETKTMPVSTWTQQAIQKINDYNLCSNTKLYMSWHMHQL